MKRGSDRTLVFVGAVMVAAALITVVAFGIRGPRSFEPVVTSVPHEQPAGENLRTLVVVATGPTAASVATGPLRSTLVDGRIPVALTRATVESDENCAPDAQGLSHCLNRLRMPDGTTLTVQHTHRMAEVPCLTPGEQVMVQPA